jgi:hypothetical protein
MAFALIQRSNSRPSSADHFRTMSRFSKTRLRLIRRTLIASRTEREGEVVHRAENRPKRAKRADGQSCGPLPLPFVPPRTGAKRLTRCWPGKGHRCHLGDRVPLETSA